MLFYFVKDRVTSCVQILGRSTHTQNEYYLMSCFDSIVFNFKLLHLV